jgi:Fic family protein
MRDPVLYLSAYFERDRETYMDLLLRVSQTGDWSSWVRFFLRGVVESADEAIEKAGGLLALREKYHAGFQAARSSALLQRLIDELFRTPSITIGRAMEVLKVTHAAASANVRKLQEAGVLTEVTQRKRGRVYMAREILAFMWDDSVKPATDQPAVQTEVAPN